MGAALLLGSCARQGPSTAELETSFERVGVVPALAECVARAAASLDRHARQALVATPGGLAPDLNVKVTRLVATCALTIPTATSSATTTTTRPS